jgi:sec-independent protein translocase protein TatA
VIRAQVPVRRKHAIQGRHRSNKKELTMGLDNPLHIAFLLVILLLVFGAKRLPEIGRSLGEGMRGFKSSIEGTARTPGLTTTTATSVQGTGALQQQVETAPTPLARP